MTWRTRPNVCIIFRHMKCCFFFSRTSCPITFGIDFALITAISAFFPYLRFLFSAHLHTSQRQGNEIIKVKMGSFVYRAFFLRNKNALNIAIIIIIFSVTIEYKIHSTTSWPYPRHMKSSRRRFLFADLKANRKQPNTIRKLFDF